MGIKCLAEGHNTAASVAQISSVRSEPDRRQSKTLKMDGSKKLETVFLIAICRPIGDKWQSKTLFLMILIYVRR